MYYLIFTNQTIYQNAVVFNGINPFNGTKLTVEVGDTFKAFRITLGNTVLVADNACELLDNLHENDMLRGDGQLMYEVIIENDYIATGDFYSQFFPV